MGQIISLYYALKPVRAAYTFVYGLFGSWETFCLSTSKPSLGIHPITPRPAYTFQLLPIELLLHIFSFLELKPYIISHGVCKEWQRLLPLADVNPIRRRMLDLLRHMLSHPYFVESRLWTLNNLKPFDREAYIESLYSQYPRIPEEFRLWILEWPEKMAIFGLWPGLPFMRFARKSLQRARGVNWIAYSPPCLTCIGYKHGTPDAHFIPALLVLRTYGRCVWLLFADEEPGLFGSVVVTDVEKGEYTSIYPIPHPDEDMWDYVNTPFRDWIDYLRHRWDNLMRSVRLDGEVPSEDSSQDKAIEYPVKYSFGIGVQHVLPSPPWIVCGQPQFQEELRQHPQ